MPADMTLVSGGRKLMQVYGGHDLHLDRPKNSVFLI
jgi:hypothetical protein